MEVGFTRFGVVRCLKSNRFGNSPAFDEFWEKNMAFYRIKARELQKFPECGILPDKS